jgi:precorrin-2 dehydrogenase/sirohydrochlorin ferrochelatase
MSYYPVFLDIEGKSVLVVGGGRVAERKVSSLLEAGALVTVLAPRLTKELSRLSKKRKAPKITHIKGAYAKGALEGFSLVIGASNSLATNKAVSKEANILAVPVNIVDNAKLSNFIVPAVVKRGELKIAISTGGQSPFMAKAIKESFDEMLPKELSELVLIMGAVRNKLLKKEVKNDKKLRLYADLLASPMLELLMQYSKGHGEALVKIDSCLKDLLGRGYTLSALFITLDRSRQ